MPNKKLTTEALQEITRIAEMEGLYCNDEPNQHALDALNNLTTQELSEAKAEIERLKESLSASERFRSQDAMSAINESNRLHSELTQLKASKEVSDEYVYLVFECDRSSVLFAFSNEKEAEEKSKELRKDYAPSVTYDIEKVKLSHLTPKESDAVEFAEWAKTYASIFDGSTFWNYKNKNYTTQELYSIFKNSR